MRQYLDAVRRILETGTRKENRTGVDTLSTFGVHYNIDLQQGFPLLTTKAIKFEHIVVELLWFLSGQTDIGILRRHGFKFWEAWVGKDGKAPSPYGYFWRNFPVHEEKVVGGAWQRGDFPNPDAADPVIFTKAAFNDQLAWVVETLKRDPMSRRMVVSAWAPGNAQTSALPPCHCLFVVNVQMMRVRIPDAKPRSLLSSERERELMRYMCPVEIECGCTFLGSERSLVCNEHDFDGVTEQRLCLHLTQRSCDIALGVPYNIASYALLMHLLSRFSGIPVGTFSHLLADAHAYTAKPDGSKAEYDHVPGLRDQLSREPRKLPQLYIDNSIRSLDDVPRLLELSTETLMSLFKLDGYSPWPAINFKVAV